MMSKRSFPTMFDKVNLPLQSSPINPLTTDDNKKCNAVMHNRIVIARTSEEEAPTALLTVRTRISPGGWLNVNSGAGDAG